MKTKEQRLKEVLNIRNDLYHLGYRNSDEQVKKAFDALSNYVENGEYFEDTFKIHGYDKLIHMILFTKKPIIVEIKHIGQRRKRGRSREEQTQT